MTSFVDGPAKGQHLMLKRAPMFLRAVWNKSGKWDALDQPEDKVEPGEIPTAYVLTQRPGMCHIRCGGGGSGFYTVAEYRMITPQPEQAEMIDSQKWVRWCESNRQLVKHLEKAA